LVRQLEVLFDGGSGAGLSDQQLLERFAACGDERGEAAFATIVARHGPMVLAACRQLLGDHHEAEDAFQAVFLVLARKARSLQEPDLLGNWLYGVALRTARKARGRLARRRRTEEEGLARRSARPHTAPTDQTFLDREQAEALHGEIDRLPGSFRLPVMLCYFEGLSIDEAAHRLRWPIGTLRSRLARARDKLRRGLVRRGFALSGAALAGALAPRSASACVSSFVCDCTARAAIAFAAQPATVGGALSTSTVVLAKQVLRTMLLRKLGATALLLLLFAAVATGAAYPSQSRSAVARFWEGEPRVRLARSVPRPREVAVQPRATAIEEPRSAPGRMFVAGRVLNPQGTPVANATTMVYASLKWAGRGVQLAPSWPSAIAQAQTNGSGRFRLDAPRVSSSRHEVFGIVAIAPGYGAGWLTLDPDAEEPAAEITLRPEQVIQGRVFDVQGRPVRGVKVTVDTMNTIPSGNPDGTLQQAEGPYFLTNEQQNLPAWPRPAITNEDGRFTIHGAGRGIRLGVWIDDPRFARLRVDIDTDAHSDTKNVTMALEPARVIMGRVTYADTGEPAPETRVEVETHTSGNSAWAGDFETDKQGRFRANPGAAEHYSVTVFAPESAPYLTVTKDLEWPKGALEQTLDLALPRGIVVRGKVIEEGSGKPIAGARVSYISSPNREARLGSSNGRAATAEDGSFQLGVLSAPGYITVLGPGEDFVLQEIGRRMALAGEPGGPRFYSHAFHRLDLKPSSGNQDVTVALRPSASVACQVVAPDGRPAKDAMVISRVILLPTWIAWLSWRAQHCGAVHDGHFSVHGLPVDAEVPVYFLDAKHNLGATALLSGKAASGGPVTVRLEPCGAARARLVDSTGKPVPWSRESNGSYTTMLVVTPGPHHASQNEAELGRLAADQDLVARFDPIHYAKSPVSDDRGELTLPALIPGATYRIYDSTIGQKAGPRLRKEFTVKAGETLHLGDILIENPN